MDWAVVFDDQFSIRSGILEGRDQVLTSVRLFHGCQVAYFGTTFVVIMFALEAVKYRALFPSIEATLVIKVMSQRPQCNLQVHEQNAGIPQILTLKLLSSRSLHSKSGS